MYFVLIAARGYRGERVEAFWSSIGLLGRFLRGGSAGFSRLVMRGMGASAAFYSVPRARYGSGCPGFVHDCCAWVLWAARGAVFIAGRAVGSVHEADFGRILRRSRGSRDLRLWPLRHDFGAWVSTTTRAVCILCLLLRVGIVGSASRRFGRP